MPRRSLRCVVEIDTHAVTCPGVYMPRRDDVYLSICLFGQIRRTQLTSPLFPLVFHEKFKFDKLVNTVIGRSGFMNFKIFYTAYQPSHVAQLLEDEPLIIELVQLSNIYEGGKLLAYYEGNARDFFYPYPTYSPTYGTQDRDVLLERSLDFPGISPRLEFSTKTVISEATTPVVSDYDVHDDVVYVPRATSRQSRTRTKSPRRKNKNLSFGRPTVASISRTRSLSPSMRRNFEALNLDDTYEQRPPFVVRKVTSRNLIGRDPGTPSPKQKIKCMHGTYSSSTNKNRSKSPFRYRTNTDYLDLNTDNLAPYYRRKGYSSLSDDASYASEADSDILDLTSYRSRYRSPSPVYRSTSPALYTSTLSDRYLDGTWSPTRSEVIKARVDRAIERNRATAARLDRLDSMYPYSSYRYRFDDLDELELDLELARRRRARSPYLYY